MHDIWLTPPRERIKKWREFRQHITSMPLEQAIMECLSLWESAPISSRFLDIHDCKTWPKPWDLVYSGDFDEDSITLGITYTMYLSGWEDTQIVRILDQENSFEKLVIIIDNNVVLRYSRGKFFDKSILNSVDQKDKIHLRDLI